MTALQQLPPAADPALLTRGMDSPVSIMLAESIEQSSHTGRRKAETAATAAGLVARFRAGGFLHLFARISWRKTVAPAVVRPQGKAR